MAVRALASLSLRRSNNYLKIIFFNPLLSPRFSHEPFYGHTLWCHRFHSHGQRWVHSGPVLSMSAKAVGTANGTEEIQENGGNIDNGKMKRKKLKGKRAVVKWLKSFRWKKKKEFQRMTAEEKILYKLRLARKKEERFVEALKKIEPKETSETTHDPEILTPEEHFFFLNMGRKCKNYVPVGRRGIYGGVILNMHLHWKKHQTLQVIVKTFPAEEVKELATELARLTGGIVLDIHDENTIIMYRGKNYSQPPTEIMSPRETLSRKKALDKSKYRDGLRAVRKYIPRLEEDLRLLQARTKSKPASFADVEEKPQETELETVDSESHSNFQLENSDELKEVASVSSRFSDDDDDATIAGFDSDSEDLSDLFDTDSENGMEETERPLYLEEFEKFPSKNGELEDFEDHFRRMSMESSNDMQSSEDARKQSYDEIDRLFLRAASLLQKKKK